MKTAQLLQKVKEWDLFNPDDRPDAAARFESILERLKWFGDREWHGYVPAEGPGHSTAYLVRLAEWVGNMESDADRQRLLEYAMHIAFFSHTDFQALYRTAFSGTIARWVVEQEGLMLNMPDFQARLAEELHRRTWYCPVTDSMDINEFCHANHIVGVSHRPGFALLKMLDAPIEGEDEAEPTRLLTNLKNYINNPDPPTSAPPLKRLVLLEDFVGSGTQTGGALRWAAKNLDLPVLCVPLVVCAPGVEKLSAIAAQHTQKVRFAPLLTLRERDLLGPRRNGVSGIECAEGIERLAGETFERVAGGPHADDNVAPHTAFGFKQTGASFVSYSNTPNNTLPLIHHRPANGEWQPLFPRSARV